MNDVQKERAKSYVENLRVYKKLDEEKRELVLESGVGSDAASHAVNRIQTLVKMYELIKQEKTSRAVFWLTLALVFVGVVQVIAAIIS